MSGATGFLWLAVVLLALMWVLNYTGTIRFGVNFDLWLTVLLVLSVLGAVFNMFIVPFLGRSRTSRTESSASGTVAPGAAPPGAVPPGGPPASGAGQQEVVQETRDRTTM